MGVGDQLCKGGMVDPGGPRPCLKGAAATQIQLKAAVEDSTLVLPNWLFPREARNQDY